MKRKLIQIETLLHFHLFLTRLFPCVIDVFQKINKTNRGTVSGNLAIGDAGMKLGPDHTEERKEHLNAFEAGTFFVECFITFLIFDF